MLSSPRVDLALETARFCLAQLTAGRDLSPGAPAIHVAMAALEGLCRAPYTEPEALTIIGALTTTGELALLRRMLSDAEHADEFFHARRLLRMDDPDLPRRLDSVYARMVEAELAVVRAHGGLRPGSKVAFVGCGALPLTSVYVSLFSGLPVVALDRARRCIAVGRRVAHRLGADLVRFLHIRGDALDYGEYAVVYVASLVPDKQAVLARIAATNPGALALTRGGVGLRQLFYAPLDIEALSADGWFCLAVAPPPEGVKNTSYLLGRRAAD